MIWKFVKRLIQHGIVNVVLDLLEKGRTVIVSEIVCNILFVIIFPLSSVVGFLYKVRLKYVHITEVKYT